MIATPHVAPEDAAGDLGGVCGEAGRGRIGERVGQGGGEKGEGDEKLHTGGVGWDLGSDGGDCGADEIAERKAFMFFVRHVG